MLTKRYVVDPINRKAERPAIAHKITRVLV
jgi:hypothetical protein